MVVDTRQALPCLLTGPSSTSQTFIADVLQDPLSWAGVAANAAPAYLIKPVVKGMKKGGGFTLPSFEPLRRIDPNQRQQVSQLVVSCHSLTESP